jgi:hypothetical protein
VSLGVCIATCPPCFHAARIAEGTCLVNPHNRHHMLSCPPISSQWSGYTQAAAVVDSRSTQQLSDDQCCRPHMCHVLPCSHLSCKLCFASPSQRIKAAQLSTRPWSSCRHQSRSACSAAVKGTCGMRCMVTIRPQPHTTPQCSFPHPSANVRMHAP